jgi:hypothetical protein
MPHFHGRHALAWLGILIILVLAPVALAQGTGSLEGQVVNGTDGGPAVAAGLPVSLYVLQGNSEVDVLETTTDADGRFRFEALDMDGDLEYWPEALYLDVPYRSAEPYRFDGGEETLPTTITVFETTEDDSTVTLDSVHFIAESFGEVLRISEIHLYGNSGDRTYVGQLGDEGLTYTVHIPLPENAMGIAFEQDGATERYLEVEGGIVDTEPVPPGQETSLAFFSYHLIVMGDTVPLERRFAYPLTHLNVLAAQPGLMLNSDQLEMRGPQSFQGRPYDLYVVEDLPAESPLKMAFAPVEVPAADVGAEQGSAAAARTVASTSTGSSQELLRWLGFGLALIAVVGAIVYAAASDRLPPASSPAPNLPAHPEARRLLAELADLDDALEAGQVDGATYERQRTELQEAIKSLNL